MLESKLPELLKIEQLIEKFGDKARTEVITRVQTAGHSLPVYAISIGPNDPTTPVLGIVGGVHGLERVGSHLSIAYMNTISRLLEWDSVFHLMFEKIRLVFVPLLNPGGMYNRTRSNPNGVDLMRNAPVEAEQEHFLKLVSGHRISPKIPWYRGALDAPMEQEAVALCNFVQKEFFR